MKHARPAAEPPREGAAGIEDARHHRRDRAESTVEYYRLIIAAYRALRPDGSYPPLFINSIDLKTVLDLAGAIVLPNEPELDFIHDKYVTELIEGVFLDETRAALLDVDRRMKDESGIQAVVLGGTELPLILPGGGAVPFLDTSRVHVARAVARMLA